MGRLGTELELPDCCKFIAGIFGARRSRPPSGSVADEGSDRLGRSKRRRHGAAHRTHRRARPAGRTIAVVSPRRAHLDASLQWCLRALGRGALQFEGAIATNLDRGVIYADPINVSRNLRELGYSIDVVQDVGKHALAGIRYDYYNGIATRRKRSASAWCRRSRCSARGAFSPARAGIPRGCRSNTTACATRSASPTPACRRARRRIA